MSYVVIPGPKRKCDREGRRVRSLRQFKTSIVAVPAGSIGTITTQHIGKRGSAVQFDACEKCRIAPIVAGLHPEHGDYEFIDATVFAD